MVISHLKTVSIDLTCLYPWAKFRKAKAAVKMHTKMDANTSIPDFIHISDGKMHDVKVLDMIVFLAGAFYVMDRDYLDLERPYRIHRSSAYFLIRAKKDMKFERVYSAKADKAKGLKCDQTIRLAGFYTSKDYP